MSPVFVFLLDTLAMIVALAVVQAAVLLMRHTNRAAWMRRATIDTLLSIAVAAIMLVAIGFEVAGLMRAGLSGEMAIMAAPVICALAAMGIWYGFDCRVRLTMASAGISPFGPLVAVAPPAPAQTQEPGTV